MLVVSRRLGEAITIGDNVTVKITRIARGQVRLAIEAPKEIRITRTQPKKEAA